MTRLIFIVLAAMLLPACGQDQQPVPTQQSALDLATRYGRVLETIDIETYSYIRIDEHGREVWLASNPAWLQEGDYIEFEGGDLMKDFYSKELDRKFDYILFVGDVRPIDKQDAEARLARSIKDIAIEGHVTKLSESDEANAGAVEPLEGGLTIAGVFAAYGGEQGQTVRFRARVEKVSMGILKRNWVTVSDGTGTAPENKVVITTQQVPEVGGIYVIEGALLFDQYIGPGYTYKVLMTDGVFTE